MDEEKTTYQVTVQVTDVVTEEVTKEELVIETYNEKQIEPLVAQEFSTGFYEVTEIKEIEL